MLEQLDIDARSLFVADKKNIYAWGCTESLKSSWNKMEKEDFVLFYVKGVFRYAGQLIYKQFSEELSDALWPRKDKSWSCVFFLANLKEIYIPLKEINELADYQLKMLQGFMILNKKGIDAIYSKYGGPERFFDIEFPRLKVIEELDLPPADFDSIFAEVGSLSVLM